MTAVEFYFLIFLELFEFDRFFIRFPVDFVVVLCSFNLVGVGVLGFDFDLDDLLLLNFACGVLGAGYS